MSTTATLPQAETWDLSAIFPDSKAIEAARSEVRSLLESIHSFEGKLSDSAQTLADAMDTIEACSEKFALLHSHHSMRSDDDTTDPEARAARQEIELLGTEFSRITSFLRPELLAMPDGQLDAWVDQEPRLAPQKQFIRNLLRQREHILKPEEERIVAEAGLLTHNTSPLFVILNNSEMPRPEIQRADGETVRLDPVNFQTLRTSANREERAAAFPEYFGAYRSFRETYAQNLYNSVKSDLFRARVRNHESCLHAALSPHNIPVGVYDNLIAQVRRALPVLHKYFRARAKRLGIERLKYHDLYCPLSTRQPRRYSPSEAQECVVRAAAPLGKEYCDNLSQGFNDRWIDWHPKPGKRTGAYSNGWAYNVHPYVLLNFIGDHDGVSTLAHEMGHAMHSFFSNRAQPYATADYTIFVAEVASTLNETLLNTELLSRAEDEDERAFLLASELDGIRGTLFRQTMFAEFEREIHSRVERGETLGGDSLSQIYLDLLRVYHGHDEGVVQIDDVYGVEWAGVPHFHYNFYVYQYATGIVAAQALARGIREEGEPARDRYLKFLSSGGSDYPLELLRNAGVDLETESPYQAAMQHFDQLVDRLEECGKA